MIYIHLKREHLDMYVTLTFNRAKYEDYMIQAGEEIHKYLPYGWKVVMVTYKPQK